MYRCAGRRMLSDPASAVWGSAVVWRSLRPLLSVVAGGGVLAATGGLRQVCGGAAGYIRAWRWRAAAAHAGPEVRRLSDLGLQFFCINLGVSGAVWAPVVCGQRRC